MSHQIVPSEHQIVPGGIKKDPQHWVSRNGLEAKQDLSDRAMMNILFLKLMEDNPEIYPPGYTLEASKKFMALIEHSQDTKGRCLHCSMIEYLTSYSRQQNFTIRLRYLKAFAKDIKEFAKDGYDIQNIINLKEQILNVKRVFKRYRGSLDLKIKNKPICEFIKKINKLFIEIIKPVMDVDILKKLIDEIKLTIDGAILAFNNTIRGNKSKCAKSELAITEPEDAIAPIPVPPPPPPLAPAPLLTQMPVIILVPYHFQIPVPGQLYRDSYLEE